MEPLQSRKAKGLDALKVLEKDALVVLQIARLFWRERKAEKTRKWLQRSVALDRDLGDAWAHYYRFELDFGDSET